MKRRKDYKLKPVHFCERCGKQLIPRVFSGQEEEYSAYMKRKYCSLICSNTRGKKGNSRTQKMVQARGKALKEMCECCGGTERLAIHHINEDWKNGRSENLQTLCVYCHQQWHGLHRRLGIKCFIPMPPLVSLSVTTYQKIKWGNYDPRIVWGNCAPTETPSMLRQRRNS